MAEECDAATLSSAELRASRSMSVIQMVNETFNFSLFCVNDRLSSVSLRCQIQPMLDTGSFLWTCMERLFPGIQDIWEKPQRGKLLMEIPLTICRRIHFIIWIWETERVLWVMIEDMQHLLYEEQLSSVRLFSLEKDRTWKGYDNSKTVSGTESWEQSPHHCVFQCKRKRLSMKETGSNSKEMRQVLPATDSRLVELIAK